MESEFARTPRNAECEKHADVGGRIGRKGIEEGSVPVEENHACGIRPSFHKPESYQGMADSKAKEVATRRDLTQSDMRKTCLRPAPSISCDFVCGFIAFMRYGAAELRRRAAGRSHRK